MKTDDIKNLLNRFYLGETSPEEEKQLADFLLQEDIPSEFLSDRKLFLALHGHSVEVPYASSEKIESLIDSFKDEGLSNKKVKPLLHVRYWAIGVAASLALIFGVSQFQKSRQTSPVAFTDTYKNPDDAYRATMDALQLFSQNFSKGTQTVEKANARLEETQKIINKSTK